MNKQEIIEEIKKLAIEEKITFMQACSAMQAAAARMNNESMIVLIGKIKRESDEYKKIFK